MPVRLPVVRRPGRRHRSTDQSRGVASARASHLGPRGRLSDVMRDLASRLRAIVNANPPEPRRHVVSLEIPEPDGFTKEDAAAALGGRVAGDDGSSYIVVDRVWDSYRSHGRRRIDDYTIDPSAPLALFDP